MDFASFQGSRRKLLKKMARPVGVEPTTYRFEVWRSIQLSYGRTVRQLYAAPSRSSKWWDTRVLGGWGE